MSASGSPSSAQIAKALAAYPGLEGARARPLGRGLINHTYLVDLARPTGEDSPARERYVLQRLNSIFGPEIHHNIVAVCQQLERAGQMTPHLLPACDGRYWVELTDGVWRLQTYVAGHSFETVQHRGQAQAAGHLLGRFHAALEGMDHQFAGGRTGVHDTAGHLKVLERSIAESLGHRLHGVVSALGEQLLTAARDLEALPDLPPLIGHGDPKLSNVLFASGDEPEQAKALCLVDLDTVGPAHLAHELGDAWRSWCARGAEDSAEGRFDVQTFAASLSGYRAGRGRILDPEERNALLLGPEWISLELAARFAADAVRESYFGYDAERYPAAGEHNLARARAQWGLHRSIVDQRKERAALLAE